jgi:hypothetical protein
VRIEITAPEVPFPGGTTQPEFMRRAARNLREGRRGRAGAGVTSTDIETPPADVIPANAHRDGHTMRVVVQQGGIGIEIGCPYDGADLDSFSNGDIPPCRVQWERDAPAPWFGPNYMCGLQAQLAEVGSDDLFQLPSHARIEIPVSPCPVAFWTEVATWPGAAVSWWIAPDTAGIEVGTEYGARLHAPDFSLTTTGVLRRVDEEDARMQRGGRTPATPVSRPVVRGAWTPLPAAPGEEDE